MTRIKSERRQNVSAHVSENSLQQLAALQSSIHNLDVLDNKKIVPAYLRLYAQGLFFKMTKDQIHKTYGANRSTHVDNRKSLRKCSVRPLSGKSLGMPSSASSCLLPKALVEQVNSHAPVLVPVSRRASSPMKAQHGSMSRPSVDPIPHTSTPCTASVSSDSTESLLEQLNVLKGMLGLSDDDLKWKVESAKGNAFIAADKHLEEAEERYDRLSCELQHLVMSEKNDKNQVLIELLKEFESEVRIHVAREVQGAESEKQALVDRADSADDQVVNEQHQVVSPTNAFHQKLHTLHDFIDSWRKSVANLQFSSVESRELSANLLEQLDFRLDCIPSEVLLTRCQSTIKIAEGFLASQRRETKRKEIEIEETIRDMEIWKLRRESSKEYRLEILKQEQLWRLLHAPENNLALKRIRSYLPLDIHKMSVEELIESAWKAGGVLYTFDMAIYLKSNRFIHWTILHEQDIARDQFLSAECARFFTNFNAYDITECRAVCASMPESFEFDKESKKMSWRVQFLQHVQMLVKQQRCEKVKAGWDSALHTRGEIALKPLQEKQLVNPIYLYPSDQEISIRLEKYQTQQSKLMQKKARLEHIENAELISSKQEYLATAEDARDEGLKKRFGKDKLVGIREQAKLNYQRLCKERDALKIDICGTERLLHATTPSYDQYLIEVEKIRKLDPGTRASRIQGPFTHAVDAIQPRLRATARKLSVEQEAEDRKQELRKAIADRDKAADVSDKTEPLKIDTRQVLVDDNSSEKMSSPVKCPTTPIASPQLFSFLENHFAKLKCAQPAPTVSIIDEQLSDDHTVNTSTHPSIPKSKAVLQLLESDSKQKVEDHGKSSASQEVKSLKHQELNFLKELTQRTRRN